MLQQYLCWVFHIGSICIKNTGNAALKDMKIGESSQAKHWHDVSVLIVWMDIKLLMTINRSRIVSFYISVLFSFIVC